MTPIHKLCVSSTGGGGGKTLFSLSLGRALSQAGMRVKPYKKGPDYIDAAWLSTACRLPATNLDSFFLSDKELKKFFQKSLNKFNPAFALLEGNRGLYDGLDENGACSTAHIARLLNFPILLTLDCAKLTRTLAAIIKGLTEFEQELNFIGVILNNIGSSRHENSLRKALNTSLNIPVLGVLPRFTENPLPERHMGLATTGSLLTAESESILDRLAETLRKNCDIANILVLTRQADPKRSDVSPVTVESPAPAAVPKFRPVIGYVEDDAFWFYYPENLEALSDSGAVLKKISLLNSADITWEELCGLYIGGGFPEDYCARLSNSRHLAALRQNALLGLPIYAECGGLLLLAKTLTHKGQIWPMANVFPLKAVWRSRPAGLGYVEGEVIGDNPFYPKGMRLRGHEFHYTSCEPLENTHYQIALSRGTGLAPGLDGLCRLNTWASYLHIFSPGLPLWSENFVRLAKSYQTGSSRSSRPDNS